MKARTNGETSARDKNIQFAEKAEVSLFVRHVCACPSRHFGPVQTPSVVARASSAVDSPSCTRGLASRTRRGTETKMERMTEARSRKDEAKRREAWTALILQLWVTKARDSPLVLPSQS